MRLQFPEGFLLGVSSASAQIEGGEVGSNWNDWYHQGRIKDDSDPAVADDHWNRWREDCALMAGLHLPIARMGVEWARIMPARGEVDEAAIAHYRAELEYMRQLGIRPLLTIHHFSNPMWFERLGGFSKRENLDDFLSFAKLCADRFGDLVSDWITINEPNVYATNGYFFGDWPPGHKSFSETFTVLEKMAFCHIRCYQMLHATREAMGYSDTMVGFANHLRVFEPENPKNPVQAATAAELVAAIAPDTEIILAPGDYDLTELAGKTDNPYVVWYEEFDGPQLNVVNVSGLTIRGQDRDQVELLATPRYADVFHFQGCSDLVLDGLTIGHTPTGSCLGSECGLYGCGTYGVESEGVTGLLVEKSAIYHCSYGAATILNSQTVTFDGCEVYDNMAWSLFGLTSSSGVTLSDTVVRNNGSNADGGSYLLSLSNCDAVAVRGCRFEDNALANFSDTSAGNLALAVENCTFEGNSFAAPNG